MKKISIQQKSGENFPGGKELTFNVLFSYTVQCLNPIAFRVPKNPYSEPGVKGKYSKT